jgi:hypothetical protein
MNAINGPNPMTALHRAGISFELTISSGVEKLPAIVPFKGVAPAGLRSTGSN